MVPLFGLRPAVGRLLTGDNDVTPGAHPLAVLSYVLLEAARGRDPGIVAALR